MRPAPFPAPCAPRYGKFEHARGGTILLDEIGSMPLDLQAKLLRVIQERVDHPARLQRGRAARRALHRHQQGRPRGRGRGRPLPRRPALSPQRRDACACRRCRRGARTCRCCSCSWSREAAARYRRDDVDVPPQVDRRDRPARLAGQCARAAQRRRPLRARARPAPADSRRRRRRQRGRLADRVADVRARA